MEEGEDLIYSAAREWAEETLGLFLTLSYPLPFTSLFSLLSLLPCFHTSFPLSFQPHVLPRSIFNKRRYNKESEKKSIDDCTQHTLQLLLAPSSPSLYPLASSYNYHIFFFKIPFQNLDIINSEFTKVSKKRKFWWVRYASHSILFILFCFILFYLFYFILFHFCFFCFLFVFILISFFFTYLIIVQEM